MKKMTTMIAMATLLITTITITGCGEPYTEQAEHEYNSVIGVTEQYLIGEWDVVVTPQRESTSGAATMVESCVFLFDSDGTYSFITETESYLYELPVNAYNLKWRANEEYILFIWEDGSGTSHNQYIVPVIIELDKFIYIGLKNDTLLNIIFTRKI